MVKLPPRKIDDTRDRMDEVLVLMLIRGVFIPEVTKPVE
jgi:hypothetical protein